MEDIRFHFKKIIEQIIDNIPTFKEKITTVLKNPIQLKIIKHTFSVGLLVIGVVFLGCYMAGASRTHSFNPAHAFAFRYYPFYILGIGVTYGAYKVSYYFLNDVVDGDKLTPSGEKGSSEWMIQDEEIFRSYKLVLASKANSDWNHEKEREEKVDG